jgi:hypothetical protein
VTSRNIDASWFGTLPSTGDSYRAVRRGGKGFEKPGPQRGKGFEKLQPSGGKGFEKVVRKGSLRFENRQDERPLIHGIVFVTALGPHGSPTPRERWIIALSAHEWPDYNQG